MNKKQYLKKNVKTFVEEYNKRIDWNKEVIESIGVVTVSDGLKTFLDEYISLEKITEENYDLKHASVYKYGPDEPWANKLELNVFSYNYDMRVYFWVNPVLGEKEYKKKKLEIIKKVVNEKIVRLSSEIDKLTKEKNELSEMKEKIS